MLDVKEDQPDSASSDTPSNSSKPFLKFGVSAILGLDKPSTSDSDSIDTEDEDDETLTKSKSPFPASGLLGEMKPQHPFHPAYLPPYFHPLIQSHKTLSGSTWSDGHHHQRLHCQVGSSPWLHAAAAAAFVTNLNNSVPVYSAGIVPPSSANGPAAATSMNNQQPTNQMTVSSSSVTTTTTLSSPPYYNFTAINLAAAGQSSGTSLVAAVNRPRARRGMMRRAVFSELQRRGLERRFQVQKYISKPERKKLAEKLGLKDSQARPANHRMPSDPDWVPTRNLPDNKSRELALTQSATNDESNPVLVSIGELNMRCSAKGRKEM